VGWANYSRPPPRRKPASWAAGLALALFGAMAPAAAGDPVPVTDPAAIADALRDRTLYGTLRRRCEPWTEYYSPDGRSAFAVHGCVYRGKWWAADGKACFSYPELEAGDVSCFAMTGMTTFWNFSRDGADGGPVVVAKTRSIAAGNPDHMPLDVGACVGM